MSMIPFFPSLKPPLVSSIWFGVDIPCDDENELRLMEKEHQQCTWEISQTSADLQPIGKTIPSTGPDTDDEEANDDSEDSDNSHDNDEDDEEVVVNDNNQIIPEIY